MAKLEERREEKMGAWTGVWIGYALAFLALAGIVWGAFKAGNSPPINILVAVTGGLIGWIVGMLMTPVTGMEQIRFPEYGTALSTFVTGYLVAKIDRLFELAVNKETGITDELIGRLLMFASAFALGALATYIWRGGYISP